jgi:hypothetical protein
MARPVLRSMYGLSIVLMSVNALASYARAGLIGGAFAASEAIFWPLIRRQIDHRVWHRDAGCRRHDRAGRRTPTQRSSLI